MKKKVLLLLCFMLMAFTAACGKEKDSIYVNPDDEDTQAYWKTLNQNVAKLGEGYCYLASVADAKNPAFSGKRIYYWDPTTQESTVLCPNAECKHNDENCYAVLAMERKQGVAYTDNIWAYKENLYFVKYNSNTAILVQVAADGSGHRELFELGPRALDGGLSYCLTFHDDAVYVYDRAGNYDGAKGKNSTECIRRRSLDGSQDEVIYSYTGEHIVIENVKSFGDKLFFIVETNKIEDGYDIIGKGLYCYDYHSKEISLVEEKSVYDYYVDVDNGILYYFVSHDGLYKRPLASGSALKIYQADSSTELCNFNVAGDRIYLENSRWCMFMLGTAHTGIRNQVLIMDLEGNVKNTIYDDHKIYFGDRGLFLEHYVQDENGRKKRALCLLPGDKADKADNEDFVIIFSY